MAITLSFFRDSGLSVPGLSMACNQADDGSSAAIDRVFYLGSPVVGRQFENAAPGIDEITVSVEDSGSGVLPTAVKLALSAVGLDSAVAGELVAVVWFVESADQGDSIALRASGVTRTCTPQYFVTIWPNSIIVIGSAVAIFVNVHFGARSACMGFGGIGFSDTHCLSR